MSNASIPQDLLERILEYLPRDASLFLNFGHASRTCYALSSHDKHWKHCWAKRFADAQPQKNYKTTFIKLCKYLKKHPNDKPDAYEIKTVMVGNTGVGKTNMHVRYMNQCYLADLDTNK
jgi:glycyl-tRNA synthetase (class II)